MSDKLGPAVRKIATPPRGSDGLFIQPTVISSDRERDESHHRESFANHFNFADDETGLARTLDLNGRYNCGACNQRDGKNCLLVDIPYVDLEAGSCEDWENRNAGDQEMKLRLKTFDMADYAVAANGVGWSCDRCPFASKAFVNDSRGRSLYCGKGDFRTFPIACCSLNGAKQAKLPDGFDDDDDEGGYSAKVDELRRRGLISDRQAQKTKKH